MPDQLQKGFLSEPEDSSFWETPGGVIAALAESAPAVPDTFGTTFNVEQDAAAHAAWAFAWATEIFERAERYSASKRDAMKQLAIEQGRVLDADLKLDPRIVYSAKRNPTGGSVDTTA